VLLIEAIYRDGYQLAAGEAYLKNAFDALGDRKAIKSNADPLRYHGMRSTRARQGSMLLRAGYEHYRDILFNDHITPLDRKIKLERMQVLHLSCTCR
jgi:hypothetical protein